MKKFLVILLCILVSLSLFAEEQALLTEYFNSALDSMYPVKAKRVIFGDVDILDDGLSEFDLAVLSNEELRVLRNMIYARHGNIFTSEDLTVYYSNFPWYVPSKKVSDSELSESELQLIERIRLFETRDERKTNMKLPGVEGLWQNTWIMAAGWSDRFAFYSDGRLEFRFSQMYVFPVAQTYKGTYQVKGNVLVFTVDEISYSEAVPEYRRLTDYWDFESMEGRQNTITFSDPLVMKFPIVSFEQDKALPYPDLVRVCLKLGNVTYYKYTDNPDGD